MKSTLIRRDYRIFFDRQADGYERDPEGRPFDNHYNAMNGQFVPVDGDPSTWPPDETLARLEEVDGPRFGPWSWVCESPELGAAPPKW